MVKRCPRCGHVFECRSNDIAHCQCTRVLMPHGLPSWVKELYNECLCEDCLRALAKEASDEAESSSKSS
ncbi:cysteine-rich CWC family protein [Ruficoccus sp. ZRK36]|uniref:cysteine-rich CWC family protein n=1 Tax=Ruficoccus sp. ZRK36 TaxID=2866311 RepID=UPI001C7378A7|nr:cysteine-rich CWC family protein [Ruficoccus sp. ZRK36]QYY36215.1 cysteine-rich CWC family protein [Ruficoccus sp. ZRK36]